VTLALLRMRSAANVKVPATPLTRGRHALQQAASQKRQGTKSREMVSGPGRGLLMRRGSQSKELARRLTAERLVAVSGAKMGDNCNVLA
jgi:hypothetical protein